MKKEEFVQMNEGGVGGWWYDARRTMLEKELASFLPESKKKILDLAAACGGNFDVCSRYGKVIGLDVSWDSIEYCKQKKATVLVQADAEILPFANESIDIVVALDVFEHLKDDSCSMREILLRILSNLHLAFSQQRNRADAELIEELLLSLAPPS